MPIRYLALFFTLCFAKVNAKELNDYLVAKYSFNNGKTNDDKGILNAKAYNVDLTEDRFGNKNMAFYFRGQQGSYINLGTSELLKPKVGSISLWVNCHGLMGLGKGVDSNPILWTRSDTVQDCSEAYVMCLDMNTKRFNCANNNSCLFGVSAYSRNKIELAKWYHLVMIYDKQNLWFYLNGELQYKLNKNFESKFLSGDSVLLGGYYNLRNIRYFFGCIDDVEIYNKVLSEEEVKLLYHAPDPNQLNVFLRWIIFGFAMLATLIALIWMIKKYAKLAVIKEKEKNKLINHAYEQDIKVLKAQMNPHFIFNALNSIQQFIITEENEKAQTYLSKFSRLLRKILESNTGDSINLKDEIEILIGYLEIEGLRFNNVFEYELKIIENIKPEEINIPNFLIQPFVENAIWHGILPSDTKGKLKILFEKADETTLRCTVDDNGVGRKKDKTEETIKKDKSLAIDFIQQRLALMSLMYKKQYVLKIIDKEDAECKSSGTQIVITLPII